MKKPNLLIVDDHYENLIVLERLLEGLGCNIIKAGSGQEALKKVLEYNFALVMLDVQMPEMDGFETAELMRSVESTKFIPIIFVTAISKEAKYVFKGYEAGAVDYIFKPFDPLILKSKAKIFIELSQKREEINEKNEILQKLNKRMELALTQTLNLVKFSREINLLDLNSIIKVAKKRLPSIFYEGNYSLFLMQDNEKAIKLAAHNRPEWADMKKSFIVYENDSIMWDTIRDKRIIKIKNFGTSRYAKSGTSRNYKSEAVVCVPLQAGKKVVGVINFNNFPPQNMTVRNIANIQRIADHMALAISNAFLHRHIKKMSIIDELTEFYNRRYLFRKLYGEIKRSRRYKEKLSVLMIDLDHFKNINDMYGHHTGDIVLKELSVIMRESLRYPDVPCRYGGEEFVIILPNSKGKNAFNLAERLRKKVASSVMNINEKLKLSITISIGVAELKKKDKIDSLLERADSGLYQAKDNGRNQTVFAN